MKKECLKMVEQRKRQKLKAADNAPIADERRTAASCAAMSSTLAAGGPSRLARSASPAKSVCRWLSILIHELLQLVQRPDDYLA